MNTHLEKPVVDFRYVPAVIAVIFACSSCSEELEKETTLDDTGWAFGTSQGTDPSNDSETNVQDDSDEPTDSDTREIEGWRLVWFDEFDAQGRPDPSKWSYEQGYIRNNEAQYYAVDRPENARVEGGALLIEARKDWHDGHEITSASLHTKGKASWTYGRIEVRAKVPPGNGTWPAIWTLGTNIDQVGWPNCGEIDIMEYVGYDPNHFHFNIHTDAFNHAEGTNKGTGWDVPGAHEQFHVFAIEWDAAKIDFVLDGERTFTFENDGTGIAAWPYDEDQYLILNLAIGGSWGGLHGIADEIFPARYLIDYVRVYQR